METPRTWRPRRRTVALVAALLVLLSLRNPAQALGILGTIVLGMSVLTLIVVVHEFAHAFTAQLMGVRVLEFGLFFPPRFAVLGHVRGVPVSLNWLPIGGFTRLAGEKAADGPDSFKGTTLPRRLAIILAGPLANLLLAYLIVVVVAATSPTHAWWEAPGRALYFMAQFIAVTLGAIVAIPGSLLSNPGNAPVAGIPGIVTMAGIYASSSLRDFVLFIALLSTSIGVLNLLPIPPLDGGVATLAVVERFGGRRLVRFTTAAGVVGLVFILGLVVFANGADLISLLQGQNRYLP